MDFVIIILFRGMTISAGTPNQCLVGSHSELEIKLKETILGSPKKQLKGRTLPLSALDQSKPPDSVRLLHKSRISSTPYTPRRDL